MLLRRLRALLLVRLVLPPRVLLEPLPLVPPVLRRLPVRPVRPGLLAPLVPPVGRLRLEGPLLALRGPLERQEPPGLVPVLLEPPARALRGPQAVQRAL